MPLCYTSLSVEVNSIKWCQEALTEHLSVYPVSVFLFPAVSAEELGKTSLHCQMLHGPTKKGWCFLYGGGSIALEIWNVSVGGRLAEINPVLQILPLVLIHGEGGQRLSQHLC